MQLTPSLFTGEYDELADLTDSERSTARNWHEDFRGTNDCFSESLTLPSCFSPFTEKYDIVGRLLKPGEKPTVYPQEESVPDSDQAAATKKSE